MIPTISVTYAEEVDKRTMRVYRRVLKNEQWRLETLFDREIREPVLGGGIIYSGYSPDYRYYYESSWQVYQVDDTRLWTVGSGVRVLKESAFECVFSPDCRWLAGCHKTYPDKIAFFKLPEARETIIRVRPYTYSHFCGWYPNSRHFWFGSWKGWYRLRVDALYKRPERLSKQEYERLFRDWDLLNSRFRTDWATLEERKVFYCYSLRGNARARAYPSVVEGALLAAARGERGLWHPQTVEVQTRRGQRYRVVSNRDERVYLRVSAVSDDGRWVLVAHHQWDAQVQREVVEWRLYEATQRRLVRTWTEREIPPFVELIEIGA